MSSQIIQRLSRQAALSTGFVFVLATLPSCSRRSLPPTAKPPASIVAPPMPPPPRKPPPPKPRLPIAFPDLDTGQISSVQFSPDGRRLAFGYGTDAEISMWNLETGRLAWQRHVEGASGGPLTFDPQGRFLVVQCFDPDASEPIWVCSVEGRLLQKLPGYDEGIEYPSVSLEHSGCFLITSGIRAEPQGKNKRYSDPAPLTEVWNTRSWRRQDHVAAVLPSPVSLTPAGRIISRKPPPHSANRDFWFGDGSVSKGPYSVSVSGNNVNKEEIDVFYAKKKLWQIVRKNDCPRVAAISPDNRTLAVGSIGGMVELRDLRTGHLLHKTHCSEEVIRCLTYSPNGRILAAAGGVTQPNDGVRLLDSKSGRLLAVLKAEFPQHSYDEKDWTLDHPRWFASLPDLSYLASEKAVAKIRMPGRNRDADVIHHFSRPGRVRAVLRECYRRQRS